jgi:XTP/dITP diphosphohydrolase
VVRLKTLLFVTSNKGKANEVKRIVKKLKVKVVALDLPEDKTLPHEKLVVKKARDAFTKIGKPVVVEDTGLFVQGFADYPGLKSRDVLLEEGLQGFLKKCAGKKAFFRCVVGYCDGKNVRLFKGVCRGKIGRKISSKSVSFLPYLSVFIPAGFSKSVSEFSKEDLASKWTAANHRAKAFKKLEFFLQKQR